MNRLYRKLLSDPPVRSEILPLVAFGCSVALFALAGGALWGAGRAGGIFWGFIVLIWLVIAFFACGAAALVNLGGLYLGYRTRRPRSAVWWVGIALDAVALLANVGTWVWLFLEKPVQ